MKKIYTLLFVFASAINCIAQIDTSNGRYWDPVFPNVTLTSNITYGQNTKYNGQTQILKMDIYEPTGDTVLQRPLIVWAHGGSFIGGSKTDYDVTTLCNTFTKMGYVCASVEYRVGFFPLDSVNGTKAVQRATQDMKAAMRWFRQDAGGANTYRIHPDYIFVGGSSAGAFMALHLAYMDAAEFPLGLTTLNSMGGIDGTSGNPGFASDAKAVVNLCGALGDSSWLEAGDVPLCSMHGDIDAIVPFGSAIISVIGIPILMVDGSASIKPRADNVGVYNVFFPWWGADHVPYAGNNPTGWAYMDTTVLFVKEFLRPFLGMPLEVNEPEHPNVISVYPNPSNTYFTLPVEEENLTLTLTSVDGNIVLNKTLSKVKNQINISGFAKGIYLGRIHYNDGRVKAFKVIKE